MRIAVSTMILFVAAAVVAHAQASAEAELAQLEQTIMKASIEGDRATYSAILADDWRVIDMAGRLRAKPEILELLFAGPERPVTSGTIDEVAVRLFGDTAVVTGRTSVTLRTGAKLLHRFTDVFVKRGGRWQVVASQGTPILP